MFPGQTVMQDDEKLEVHGIFTWSEFDSDALVIADKFGFILLIDVSNKQRKRLEREEYKRGERIYCEVFADRIPAREYEKTDEFIAMDAELQGMVRKYVDDDGKITPRFRLKRLQRVRPNRKIILPGGDGKKKYLADLAPFPQDKAPFSPFEFIFVPSNRLKSNIWIEKFGDLTGYMVCGANGQPVVLISHNGLSTATFTEISVLAQRDCEQAMDANPDVLAKVQRVMLREFVTACMGSAEYFLFLLKDETYFNALQFGG
jgi:hypothetical protein